MLLVSLEQCPAIQLLLCNHACRRQGDCAVKMMRTVNLDDSLSETDILQSFRCAVRVAVEGWAVH